MVITSVGIALQMRSSETIESDVRESSISTRLPTRYHCPMKPRFIIAALLLAIPSLARLFADTHPWVRDPALGDHELEEQWPLLENPPGPVGVRGVFRFALEAAGLKWHPERIEAALVLARSLQDLDPGSKTYGNFRWRSDQAEVFDPNAVEFTMAQATLIRRQYASSLTPSGLKRLDQLIEAGIEGMHRHKVGVAYTNIFLLKSNNLIAAGEILGRPEIAEEGYRSFDAWLAYTASFGIGEYGAVNYYGADLDPLGLLAKYPNRTEARAKAEVALRYFWTDIAANWWAPGDRLGGANSRTYDYLYGHGYLESHTWPAGWLRKMPELEGAGWLMTQYRKNLTIYYDDCSWLPPPDLTGPIRAQVPRIVVQRWGPDPAQRATNYIGHAVSLASSGATTSREERTLVANLGDSPSVPQVTLFMDGRGDPFGTKKEAEKQGAMKALHLMPFIADVQRGSEVVQVLSDEPFGAHSRNKPGELSCFLAQLIFAAQAEVWVDDVLTEPGTPDKPVAVPARSPIYIRLGAGALGVRFLLGLTTAGTIAPIEFVEESRNSPARRITLILSKTEPTGRGTVVVWIRAADELDDAGFAAFRRGFAMASASASVDGATLTAEISGEHGPMRIVADLIKGRRLVLEGGEPDALLSVNGRDLGREMLRGFVRN
jgi:hypothetical protein